MDLINPGIFDEQMERIKLVLNRRTQTELAKFFGVSQSAISDAKRRRRVPPSWLVILERVKNVNRDWVLTGNGPRLKSSSPISNRDNTIKEKFRHIADEKNLRGLASWMLADELLRRIEVSDSKMFCAYYDDIFKKMSSHSK